MAKVITKEDVTAAVEKAVTKATTAENKRCAAALRTVEGDKVTKKACLEAIKPAPAEE